ncbi:MAG: formylmethanofuran--tetrahydromethanopterin N-formyltransferase [Gemmatales bacterium]|nr:formylmethanofuran--tetrahydromethanopterin N-formyltransferase [Gemmatales bacterium]
MRTYRGVEIEDTFAEAFPMTAGRAIVTAATPYWARIAAQLATGYATSVIACDAEAGCERELSPQETPDGRVGVSLLFFAFSRDALQKALVNRIGQCILTCPTTACYNGLPLVPDKVMRIGGQLRYFGDGWQISKVLEPCAEQPPPWTSLGQLKTRLRRRLWRIPVMEGEFICEDFFGTVKGVAGGNFLILGESQEATLAAAESAVQAIRQLPDVILPFPGGIVRSGSKVGSRYKRLKASTNEAYCPTLRRMVMTALPEGVNCVYEIVIDGLSEAAVRQAMRVGLMAACQPGIRRISAGNYGGKLGPYHLRLYDLLDNL